MKNTNNNSVNQSFDDKFVEGFSDQIIYNLKYRDRIKIDLLTATLREYVGLSTTSELDTDPYTTSTIYYSMSGKFHSDQIKPYRYSSKADTNALNLYLRNLTKIQAAILHKLDEYPDITDSHRLELKNDTNEACAILQDLKKYDRDVSPSAIIYARKDDGTAKAIMKMEKIGQYCGDIMEHSSVTSQFSDDFPEGYIEMARLRRDNSIVLPSLKINSVKNYNRREESTVLSIMHGKGLVLYDGSRNEYEGGFFDGRADGKGRIKWKNGDVYEGEFVKGNAEREGRFTWKNGDTYQGEIIFSGNTIKVVNEGIFTSSSGRTIKYNFAEGESVNIQDVVLTQDQTVPNNSQVRTSFDVAFPLKEISNVQTK